MVRNHVTRDQYIRRETAVSVAINTALSLAFYLVVFGRSGQVPLWGLGAYVFDFVPQGFMIGLMATLVPSALARKALGQGRITAIPQGPASPGCPIRRALLVGATSAGIGAGCAAAASAVAGATTIDWHLGLLLKLAFGATLAALVTPLGLAETLGR